LRLDWLHLKYVFQTITKFEQKWYNWRAASDAGRFWYSEHSGTVEIELNLKTIDAAPLIISSE